MIAGDAGHLHNVLWIHTKERGSGELVGPKQTYGLRRLSVEGGINQGTIERGPVGMERGAVMTLRGFELMDRAPLDQKDEGTARCWIGSALLR